MEDNQHAIIISKKSEYILSLVSGFSILFFSKYSHVLLLLSHLVTERLIMPANWLEFCGSIGMVISTSIALIVSLVYLIAILWSQGRNMLTSTLLSGNTFLAALAYSSAHFSIAISLLRSDIAVTNGTRIQFNNPFCMSSAFVFYGGCALLYYSYVMEAIQRFSRVVLYDYRWLHEHRTQILFIILQWLFCILGTFIPLSTTNQLQYDVYMNMCIIPIRSSGWTMYYAIFCYSIH